MEVSIFQVFEQKWLWGRALVQLLQRVLITFSILFLQPFYYSVPNSDPQIKTVFYSLILKAQITDISYPYVL